MSSSQLLQTPQKSACSSLQKKNFLTGFLEHDPGHEFLVILNC